MKRNRFSQPTQHFGPTPGAETFSMLNTCAGVNSVAVSAPVVAVRKACGTGTTGRPKAPTTKTTGAHEGQEKTMAPCTNEDPRATADQFLLRMQQAHRAGVGVQRGRDLMRSAGVDPETARQALERLVAKGLVEKAPGEPGAWMLTAEGLPQVEERPTKAAPAVEQWDGTGPRWWPTVVPGRPRYYPVAGKAPEKVLLAFEAFPNGARPKDISQAVGEEVSNRLAELVTYGVLAKDGHGLYRLAIAPAPGVAVEGTPEPAGEAPALGWQRPVAPTVEPATLADQALVAEIAELRATVTAVRAHLGATQDEDLAAAALRVVAGRDLAQCERDDAREGCRRLAVELEAETRRADGLERIASRRPVVPGPRLPVPGPSILGPEIAKAAREVACDGCATAIGEIADHLGLEDVKAAEVANVVKALVDDLDALGEQVAGIHLDPAEVVEILRKRVAKVAGLEAELAAERVAGVAVMDHVRTLAGDLAVARAEVDARNARVISRALREGGGL